LLQVGENVIGPDQQQLQLQESNGKQLTSFPIADDEINLEAMVDFQVELKWLCRILSSREIVYNVLIEISNLYLTRNL
jgi:hypothetical protein